MNWQEFFAMGGYGFYVWLSYGLCALVLIFLVINPVIQRKKLLRQLALKQKRMQS
jgi:heme exporter protein D